MGSDIPMPQCSEAPKQESEQETEVGGIVCEVQGLVSPREDHR